MTDKTDREPIVGEGPYAVVPATDDESADYWLVSEDGEAFPLEQTGLDGVVTALTRLQKMERDAEGEPETVELTCHECGKTWHHAGDDEHATCPNCDAEVPVEGIGP